jgi:hypothetical protein
VTLCRNTQQSTNIQSEIIMLRAGIVELPNVGKSNLFKFNV